MSTKKSGGVDATDVLKRLQEQEDEAFEKFQAEQRERREKALAAVVEPLRKERAEQVQIWNAAGLRMTEIDKQMDKLLGRNSGHAPERRGKGGKKQRLTEAQKIEAADAIIKAVHSAGDDGISKGDLLKKISPFPSVQGKALVGFVNDKTSTGKKIKAKGEKAQARYHGV